MMLQTKRNQTTTFFLFFFNTYSQLKLLLLLLFSSVIVFSSASVNNNNSCQARLRQPLLAFTSSKQHCKNQQYTPINDSKFYYPTRYRQQQQPPPLYSYRNSHVNANNDSNRRKNNNDGVIENIQMCRNCFDLAKVVRKKNNLFTTNGKDFIYKLLTAKLELLVNKNITMKDISGLLHSFSKQSSVTQYQHDIMKYLVTISVEKSNFPVITGKDVSIMLNAIAKVNLTLNKNSKSYNKFFQLTSLRILNNVETYQSAQDLSTTVNAYAKIIANHGVKKQQQFIPVFEAIAKECIVNIDIFNSQDIANTMHAYGKLNIFQNDNNELFNVMALKSISMIDEFNAQGLANTISAYGKVNYSHDKLFNTIAIASMKKIKDFTSQNLCITLQAYAKMNHYHKDLYDTIAQASIETHNTFNVYEIITTLQSYAIMDHYNEELFETMAMHSVKKINQFKNYYEFTVLVQSYATMNHASDTLFDTIARKIDTIVPNNRNNKNYHQLYQTREDLMNIVEAFAKMSKPHIFEELSTKVLAILDIENDVTKKNIQNDVENDYMSWGTHSTKETKKRKYTASSSTTPRSTDTVRKQQQGDIRVNNTTKRTVVALPNDEREYTKASVGVLDDSNNNNEQEKKKNMKEKFETLTVVMLKEILRNEKLPVSGKKADLIDRLLSCKTVEV